MAAGAARRGVRTGGAGAAVRLRRGVRLGGVAGIDVVGLGADGWAAVDLARDLTPDLMTLGLLTPVMGGAEAIPVRRAVAPAAVPPRLGCGPQLGRRTH